MQSCGSGVACTIQLVMHCAKMFQEITYNGAKDGSKASTKKARNASERNQYSALLCLSK